METGKHESKNYKGYTIESIGTGMYTFSHEDFDGATDSNDSRSGVATSKEEAKELIDEKVNDYIWDIYENQGALSNCCGAAPVGESEDMGICTDCKEHCEYGVDDDQGNFYSIEQIKS